jgi:capsule polysaccharide modification protein KpsS
MAYQRSPLYGRGEAGYEFDALQRQANLSKIWSRLRRRQQRLLCMNQLYKQSKN